MTWGQFLPCQRRSVWKKRTREGDGWEGKACAIATLLIASKILPGHHTIYFSFLSGLSMRYGAIFFAIPVLLTNLFISNEGWEIDADDSTQAQVDRLLERSLPRHSQGNNNATNASFPVRGCTCHCLRIGGMVACLCMVLISKSCQGQKARAMERRNTRQKPSRDKF